VSIED